MKDTEFEKKSRDHAEGMPVVGGLWFVTWSPGFSNANEIPDMDEDAFNASFNRHIAQFREWCDKYL